MAKITKDPILVTDKQCHNISTIVSTIAKDDIDFFAHIASSDKMEVRIFGCQTQDLHFQADFTNIQRFISDIPKTFDSKIKAIILQVFEFTNKEYPNNIHFCEALKAKFDACKIPYYFISDTNMMFLQPMASTITDVKFGEIIIVICSNGGFAFKVVCTKDGFKLLEIISIDDAKKDMKHFQKLFILTGKNHQKLMNIFKSKNPVLIDFIDSDIFFKCLDDIKKWMLNKSYTKNYVIPLTAREYHIGYEFGKESHTLLMVKNNLVLPIEETKKCPKTSFNYFIAYKNDDILVKYKFFKLDGDAHEFNITFKIDENNFPTYEIENIVQEYIVNFPKFCDSYKNEMIAFENYPIIGILANHSFICINKNGKFEFLESWGGQWGNPLHISFDKKKPQFGEIAEETLVKHGKYGVQGNFNLVVLEITVFYRSHPNYVRRL
uniref:Uncharacterized protein n=1 Tax=Panagrolaimus davidi TaxID=227884 RepID=A0A914P823_9BILA